MIAVCDVDAVHNAEFNKSFEGKLNEYIDYRKLLEKEEPDIVTIGTPDHWHVPISVAALRAGCDVYCEKPLTLTIEEGKQIRDVVKETGRVFQVGTQQRSEYDRMFLKAVVLARSGRLGDKLHARVSVGKAEEGGPFENSDPPAELDWEMWLGQTPLVPYCKQRCDFTFRWWLEYSGGQVTDWGVHHMDIALWAMGLDNTGPTQIEGRGTFPQIPNGYNVAVNFQARYVYPGGLVLELSDEGRNGVMFEGDGGRIFVNRGTLSGKPVEELEHDPLPREEFAIYAHDNLSRPERMGKLDAIINHMGNFFDCIETGHTPVSDVVSQHRSVSACHLGNISMRLGRPLRWDPVAERFPDDAEANTWLSREQRAGYEIA